MHTLNKYRPFKSTGDDFSTSNPMFAYYFYRYYMEAATKVYKELQDANEKSQLEAELMETHKSIAIAQQKCQETLNQKKNMKDMLEYTQLMFAKNDHDFRQGVKSKQIAQDFLTLNRLYEIIAKFDEIDDNQNKRKVYAKKKFIDIMKQIKSNPNQQIQVPKPPPQPVIEQQIKKSAFKPLPKPTAISSFNKIQMQTEVNKCLENAISELSFDRFKFAREDVLRALQLLDQIID